MEVQAEVHGAAEHEDSEVELSSEESSDEPCTPPPTTSSNQTSQDGEGTSPPTFKTVGDNIDKKVKPRYMREDRQAQMLNNFHLYAVRDRVNISELSEELPSLRAFEELKFQDILPSCNDHDEMLKNYVTLFARVVTAEIPFFKQVRDAVPLHIAHEHSREMKMQVRGGKFILGIETTHLCAMLMALLFQGDKCFIRWGKTKNLVYPQN